MNIPQHIFCIWSGDNPMSDDRKKCFDLISNNSGVSVELISPSNLHKWIKTDTPLHETYDYLSLTHKADYLRAYLMHYYGGGYSDIKCINFNWIPYFDILNTYQNLFFIGYQEIHPNHIATDNENIRLQFLKLCGMCHFIFRPLTSFTEQWLNAVHSILDAKKDLLYQYPGTYHPRAVKGGVHETEGIFTDSQYPLVWNEILGKILHQLMFENMSRYLSIMPWTNLTSYR